MSTFFSKLFPGSSTNSSSGAADFANMDSLCNAINSLLKEQTKDNTGERAAQIVRKNKELFEKKFDIESFLLNCNPDVGSAAMIAAIKGQFDVASSKNQESGTDRAVELLNHYVMGNNLVGDHLKLVPEFIFPLLRDVGKYCLEKKDKPEIGQKIIMTALNIIYPRDKLGPKVLTSAHSVLFACALKTKSYAEVEAFIDPYLDEIANEQCVVDNAEDQPSPILGYRKKGQLASLTNVIGPTPYLNPKFVLEYLYNGACILIELKRYEDALLLLEVCVSIPAFSFQDKHIDGFKKYVLLSLLLHGKVMESFEKHTATRNVKVGKNNDYKQLADVKFSRSGNTHSVLEVIVSNAKDRLKKEGNLELARLVILEMKKKTVLALVKMFSSIRLQDIIELSFLKTRQQTTDIMEALVFENRIVVKMEEDMVFWSELTPTPSKIDIEKKMKLVDSLNNLLTEKSAGMKPGMARLRPSVMYNEDEGLSMPSIDH